MSKFIFGFWDYIKSFYVGSNGNEEEELVRKYFRIGEMKVYLSLGKNANNI